MKIVVLTSNSLRHLYFTIMLSQKFDVMRVFSESKVFNPRTVYHSAEEKAVLEQWFQARDDAEEKFFGAQARAFRQIFSDQTVDVPAGEINDPYNVRLIADCVPDAVVVFGSSLLREPLINGISAPFVNMHLGLSPYYRGSGTNFWPLHNDEVQYVGVTIHRIDIGIDSGPIIHQARPVIEPADTPHTIGCKTIITGTDLMIQTLFEIEANTVKSFPQVKGVGRLYKRKDFSAQDVKVVLEKVDKGLIEAYAKNPIKVELIL